MITKQSSYSQPDKQLPSNNYFSEERAVNNYLWQLQSNQPSRQISQHYSHKIIANLDFLFGQGVLQVGKEKKLVEDLMDEHKISEEELKEQEMKAKKDFIERQLAYLRQQTSTNSPRSHSQLEDNKSLVLNKQSHKQLVLKFKKERMQQDRMYNQILYKQQQNLRQTQEINKKNQEQKLKAELDNRRQSIQKKLHLQRDKHEQFLKLERQSQSKLKQIKQRKFVYQQIEEKYHNTIVVSNLQQKKRKLKEIREYRSFNIEDLNQHEQEYLHMRDLQQSRKTTALQNQYNYQPPPKPQKLTTILEQERLQRITKLQQKKKIIEDNIARQHQFVSYLKQHFVPKIDQTKRQEIQHRVQHSKVERHQSVDVRSIGIGYLQEAKRRKRQAKPGSKIQDRPQTEINEANNTVTVSQKSQPRANTNYLTLQRLNNQHYERHRRRTISRIIKKEELSDPQKIKQLSIEADKITEALARKQKQLKYKPTDKTKEDSLELLLSSIQAKIGIIQMYK